jgi:protoporphyrinogen oxidase
VVVGGGPLGLAVSDGLALAGHQVVLLEAAPALGGLASAWTIDTSRGQVSWDRFYHVILRQDGRVLALLDALKLTDELNWAVVRSELLAGGKVYPASSVLDLLRLPPLRLGARLRVGFTVLVGAVLPLGESAARITSDAWLRRWSGQVALDELWRPMLRAKLGVRAPEASSRFIRSTFKRLVRARLSGRNGDLFGTVRGGYRTVLERWRTAVEDNGVDIRTSTRVGAVEPDEMGGWTVELQTRLADGSVRTDALDARAVVLTVPGTRVADIAPGIDGGLATRLRAIPYLGCICVSVVLAKAVTGGYLTYVTDETAFTAVVEMTHLIGTEQTNGNHLVYLPRYTEPDDALFDAPDQTIVDTFVAALRDAYPDVSAEDIVGTRVARAREVMPVPTRAQTGDPLPVRLGPEGLYLASSAQVVNGTLNIETTLKVAEDALAVIIGDLGRTQPGRADG